MNTELVKKEDLFDRLLKEYLPISVFGDKTAQVTDEFLIPLIIKAILRKESLVIVEQRDEIFTAVKRKLTEGGYLIQCFDTSRGPSSYRHKLLSTPAKQPSAIFLYGGPAAKHFHKWIQKVSNALLERATCRPDNKCDIPVRFIFGSLNDDYYSALIHDTIFVTGRSHNIFGLCTAHNISQISYITKSPISTYGLDNLTLVDVYLSITEPNTVARICAVEPELASIIESIPKNEFASWVKYTDTVSVTSESIH